jgi:hypothetical protein
VGEVPGGAQLVGEVGDDLEWRGPLVPAKVPVAVLRTSRRPSAPLAIQSTRRRTSHAETRFRQLSSLTPSLSFRFSRHKAKIPSHSASAVSGVSARFGPRVSLAQAGSHRLDGSDFSETTSKYKAHSPHALSSRTGFQGVENIVVSSRVGF